MLGSPASRRSVIAFLFLVPIVACSGFLPTAAQSFAAQNVSVAILPIVSIAFADDAEIVLSSTAQHHRASIHYDLTTNVGGAVLEAAVRSSMPYGVTLSLSAQTTHGTSLGAVELESGEAAVPVVVGIGPGLENGQEISITVESEGDEDPINGNGWTLSMTLRDPESKASKTIEKRLVIGS